MRKREKVIIFSNTFWSIYNFRLDLIRDFQRRGFDVFALATTDDFIENVAASGVEVVHLELSRKGINPIGELLALWTIYRIFRKIQPDILMQYSIKPVIYGSIAGRIAGVRRVFSTITGLGFIFSNFSGAKKWRLVRFVVIALYKIALSKNKKVFFLNDDDRQLLTRYIGFSHDEMFMTLDGEGVNTRHFSPLGSVVRAEHIHLVTDCVFLLTARMLWDKGVGIFVEAARIIRNEYTNSKFWLLGNPDDGNPASISLDQLHLWQQEGVVEYFSGVRDVRIFLEKASIFVLPTTHREGLPRSTIEAMSMCKPIITTDTPGCRETVIDGGNGFLIPPNDVFALVGAMRKFLKNPDLLSQMGEKSREIAMSRFDSTVINKKIMDAIFEFR